MLASFKGLEARRETAMRAVEEGAKAQLIDELQVRSTH